MFKGQQSSAILLILIFSFIGILFLIKRTEVSGPPGTTTTTLTITTTTTTVVTTTLPVSNCTGTNTRVCSYGTKYECSTTKCCYYDLNVSRCKPKQCADITQEFCVSCGCKYSQ